MKPYIHRIVSTAFCLILLASSAGAQMIFPVNNDGTGAFRFDQPSAAAHNSVAHVAFIGDSTGGGVFKLYYAAVHANAKAFENPATSRSDVIDTPAVVIGDGLYASARHPRIAIRSDGNPVIIFQAIPNGGGSEYKIFRALITLSSNVVVSQTVEEILNQNSSRISGDLVDPDFQYSSSDQSLRIVYSDASASDQDVYFLRVNLNSNAAIQAPILLSSLPGTNGPKPLPRLALDNSRHAHVVWTAGNTTTPAQANIYYSMVMNYTTGNSVGIGATLIFSGRLWGFPCALVENNSSIYLFAADQMWADLSVPGDLVFTMVNPSNVRKDGNPVDPSNTSDYSQFFRAYPGIRVLGGSFQAYNPEFFRDNHGNYHVSSYGSTDPTDFYYGAPGLYYAMDMYNLFHNTSNQSPRLLQTPVHVGNSSDFRSHGMQLTDDYTRPAFAYFTNTALHFWSGPVGPANPGASNLYVTYTEDSGTGKESGCSAAAGKGASLGGAFPWEAALLFPALFILLRKISSSRKGFGCK